MLRIGEPSAESPHPLIRWDLRQVTEVASRGANVKEVGCGKLRGQKTRHAGFVVAAQRRWALSRNAPSIHAAHNGIE